MTTKNPSSFLSPATQIVVQSTSFCNLDCSYCYLPNRASDKRITWETINLLLRYLESTNLLSQEVEIRWHAGEPLIVPFDFYEYCVQRIAELYGGSRTFKHSIQTNATLIDRSLAERISNLGISIGVSLDGPEALHDRHRRYRSAVGSFKAVMKGIDELHRHKVPFEIISVITRATISDHGGFYAFLESTLATKLGLNFEETEGLNAASWGPSDLVRLKQFAHELYDQSTRGTLKIREFEILERLIYAKNGAQRDLQNVCGSILALSSNGDVATYSPEFLGLQHAKWPTFAMARVNEAADSLVFNYSLLEKMQGEIEKGVEDCMNSCRYYSVCGGGRPINKLFENNLFASTETTECQLRIKLLTQVVVEAMEQMTLKTAVAPK
ncbi:MAG: GRRM system radical SAM/SPASM domain protein [Nitrospira sp. CR1.1]|jgi:uncharacterized protein|nr:GRRM system radical SAM/SPASM domain protein [Nitrospira sp. CR1.1]